MDDQKTEERPDTSFDSRRYWEERLLAHPDITGVCYVGFSPQFVELQYRSRMRQLERVLRQYQLIDLSGRSVLDVGSGTGIWLDFWLQHGAGRVAGLDFAQPSVERLKKQFPDALLVQADLSVSPLPLPEESRFDIISAFHVLLHIAEPDAFRRALGNLARHCMPGGWLIISDAIVQGHRYRPVRRSSYDKVWSLADYAEVLEANGFAIQSVQPETVLFDNPLEASSRLTFRAFSVFWRITRRWGRSPRWSRLLGPVLMVLERLAFRFYPGSTTPGAKFILARKKA